MDKEHEVRWGELSSENSYGFMAFFKFAAPFMWRGDRWHKLTTVITFILLVLAKSGAVAYPLILVYIIEAITCDPNDVKEEWKDEGCPDH